MQVQTSVYQLLMILFYGKEKALGDEWNSMFSRLTVIDPETDKGFGNTTIKSALSEIPKNWTNTIEDVLTWTRINKPTLNACIANEIYVNLNISSGAWDYVKQFVPGETIRMYYNDSIYSDYTVVATTNSHYNYEYIDEDGKHHGDTAVFNHEAMSFNTHTATGSDWDYFFEVLDGEPNSIFISKADLKFPSQFIEDLIPSVLDMYKNNQSSTYTGGNNATGLETEETEWWLNQTLANMYLLNSSIFNGSITTENWIGNYSYNGSTFNFDGSEFTYMGNGQNINISIDLLNGSSIIDDLIAGNLKITKDNLTSVMMFDLLDNMTNDDIATFIFNMETICHQIPTLRNITFFSPKLFLIENSTLFDVYFLIGAVSHNKIDDALLEIEGYYKLHGLPWDRRWVKTATDMEEDVGGILGLIVNMFFGVLSFALITSLLGLAISTMISIKKRYAEIGTLRTLGFSNKQILKMVIGEGVITAILGIIVGVIAGLIVASLIISNIPFMIFLPIIYAPPYELIGQGIGLLIIASIGVSFIPAMGAVKIDIVESIRTKGE
jgi:FtsX-like permease family protein